MPEHTLSGRRILVVEDEYLIADDLALALQQAGASLLGPFATLKRALDAVAVASEIDLAVLDVNLDSTKVFALADQLAERGVPLLFTTGYDASAVPAPYRTIPRLEKPLDSAVVVQAAVDLLSKGKATSNERRA